MTTRQAQALAAEKWLEANLLGHGLEDIQRRENDWVFTFQGQLKLQVQCLWRIVYEGRLVLTDSDHNQLFGLPAPVNAIVEARKILMEKSAQRIELRADTGDLAIVFSGDALLEVLNCSSGYESWNCVDASGFKIVAMGGGGLALWGIDA